VGIGYSSSTPLNNKLEVNGYSNTSSGYKVGNTEVINGTRDYAGRNGTLNGNLSVTGTSTLTGNLLVTGTSSLTGNVGIGITSPQKKLDVNGDINFSGSLFQNNVPVNFSGYWASNGNNIYYNNGNVGIGISNPSTDYKLSVAGKILAEELQILLVQDWYDNVFEEDYCLMDLNELESFVKQNNHLPDIPSEAEVKENGISIGEMNALLLKKVEELTLYIIEQQKMIENQHSEINNLKKCFDSKNNQ